jgi:hypothetical protein
VQIVVDQRETHFRMIEDIVHIGGAEHALSSVPSPVDVLNVIHGVCPAFRHCERSEAIHSFFALRDGLLRFARNDG